MNKLTPIQNKVIWVMQNGGCMITDCQWKNILMGYQKQYFHISISTWEKLVLMDLIYQDQKSHWYELTEKGTEIKTKIPKQFNH